jgi:hypothetical protein
MSGLLHKGPTSSWYAPLWLGFSCKTANFKSGAEGIRTPDLRRAKAALSETFELIEVPSYADHQGTRSLLRCRRVLQTM